MKAVILASFLLCALILGAAAGLLGGVIAAVVAIVFVALAVIIIDFRAGVVALMLLLPFVHVHGQALNAYLALLVLTGGVFLAGSQFGRRTQVVALPRFVWWGMIAPVVVGLLIAWPHLGEARLAVSYLGLEATFAPKDFLKDQLLLPLGVIGFVWLLANAIRNSRKPVLFLVPIAVLGLLITAGIVAIVLGSGVSLDQLKTRREFLGVLGAHANEWGPMLAVASAPMLNFFIAMRGLRRVLSGAVLAILLAGLALTFSRGGYLAFFVVMLTCLVMYGRVGTSLAVIGLCAVLVVALPTAVTERALTGVDSHSVRDMASARSGDQLSAGRFYLYSVFAPEVLKSPLWGRGTASGAWSTAVRSGWVPMLHPHNLYLRILMDIGVLGLALWAWFYWRVGKGLRAHARNPDVPEVWRIYFAGAFAGVLGMLTAGISGGHWLPTNAHCFLWISIGVAMGYWHHVPQRAGEATPRRFGIKPMRPMGATAPPEAMRKRAGATLR